ncbi:MAG: (d)CMP kinase [Gorillibacterium sp.]|nr:(d)CMP kinase [Gorillibacterium sp.]
MSGQAVFVDQKLPLTAFYLTGGASLNRFNIALDGPAGAGKSTVARLVAKALGFVYVDTGAMYRAVTWHVLKLNLHLEDVDKVIAVAREMEIVLKPGENGQLVIVDGEDVTEYIRSSEINQNVSYIARISEIRELLVAKQKHLAADKGVVMDGRDIGTKVLPDAEVKVYLTANARRRAERRFSELGDPQITVDDLEAQITNRDILDKEREVSPLKQADDAILLDTTEMSLEEVVDAVLALCRSHQ